MANVPVTFAPGSRLAHLGVLFVAPSARHLARGLTVRVSGPALARGFVTVTRARARPWSARLAPWQACGWEHALAPDGPDAFVAHLRDAAPLASSVAPETPRQLLALALWIEIEGTALRPGTADLTITVTGHTEGVEPVAETHPIRVEPAPLPRALSLYLAFDGTLGERAAGLRALLDRLAAGLTDLPSLPRAYAARAVARRALYLRPGCVVFGRDGLAVDARFESLWRALGEGRVEQFRIATPARADVDVSLSQAPRARDGAVEFVASFDRRTLGRSRSRTRDVLAQILASSDAIAGFVAEHPFAPALAAHTPWERARDAPAARTIAALRSSARIDPADAFAYRGPALTGSR